MALSFSAILLLLSLPAQQPSADLVLINAVIYTGGESGERAQALAVVMGKVAAVGTEEEVEKWIGPATRVMDLGGRFVMPGFNDAHAHLWMAAEQLMNVNLDGTRSVEEFQQRIRVKLAGRKPGEWIIGGGWDQSLWRENRYPTRADLDVVSTEYAIVLTRVDGHSVVVNSLALERAGIDRDTPDPPGGRIVRGDDGEATGWIKDKAVPLVTRLVPGPTREQRKKGLLLVLGLAAQLGVTSVQDDSIRFDSWENFLALKELKQEGKLTARINSMLPFEYPLDELLRLREEGGTRDPWLRTGPVKAEADGSGGSRSAAMFEPFANSPGNRGFMKIEPERLRAMVLERDQAGFQIALHAIGDRANRLVLDAFEQAREKNRRKDARHRIEHVQYIDDADLGRFRELGVIASMQPVHLLAEIRWTRELLGAGREYQAYRVRSVLDAGGRLALGTDYPVEGLPPMRGLYAAVAREFEAGGPEGGYQPQEKITIEEAIRAYTLGSAFAEFEEQRKGTLEPGKFADLVVLSRDISQAAPRDLLTTQVYLTMVGGRIVFQAR